MESFIFRLRSGKLVSLLATVLAVVSDSKTYLGMSVFKPDDLKIYPVFRLGWVCPGSVECVLDWLGAEWDGVRICADSKADEQPLCSFMRSLAQARAKDNSHSTVMLTHIGVFRADRDNDLQLLISFYSSYLPYPTLHLSRLLNGRTPSIYAASGNRNSTSSKLSDMMKHYLALLIRV
jgi:hypothetical protein